MNPLVSELCELIEEDMTIINELKKLSFQMKGIAVQRDLNALEENNGLKRAALLKMLALQKKKDPIISKLALEAGLGPDSSLYDVLESDTLDENSHKRLYSSYLTLQKEINELDDINSLISMMLISSYRILKTSIDIINLNGTTDAVYSGDTNVKSAKKRLYLNKKV